MESSKYLIAGGTTNWVEGLAQYYAEDERKRREHGERLKARDAEQLKVMAEQSPIKMLEKLSGLSQTVGTLARQQKAAQEQKEKLEDRKWLSEALGKPGLDKFQEYKALQWEAKTATTKEAQAKADEAARIFYEANKDELAWFIEQNSPRNVIRLRQFAAKDKFQNLSYDDYKISLKGEDLTNFDKASDADKRANWIAWQDEQLDYLELDDDFKASLLLGEQSRQLGSRKGVQQAAAISRVSTAKQVQLREQFWAIRHDDKLVNKFWVDERANRALKLTDIVDDNGKVIKTVQQQVTESIKNDLEAIAKDGLITRDVMTSFLKYAFPHAAGPGGIGTNEKTFFTKQHVNELMAAVSIGEGRFTALETSADEARAADLIRRKILGEDVSQEEQKLINRNLISSQTKTQMQGVSVRENTQTAYQQYEANYEKDIANGNLHKRIEELKAHPNQAIRDKYLPIAEKVKKIFDDNPAIFDRGSLENLVYKTRTTKEIPDGFPLSGDDARVADILERFTKAEATRLIIAGQDPTTVSAQVDVALQQFKTANGWNVVVDIKEGDPIPPGLFAIKRIDGTASWANLNDIIIAQGKAIYNHTRPMTEADFDAAHAKRLQQFPDRQTRHNAYQGLYSDQQVLGYSQTGYFSEDMKKIAAREGLKPFEALDYAITAMKRANPTFARNHNILNLEKEPEYQNVKNNENTIGQTLLKEIRAEKNPQKAFILRKIASTIRWYGYDRLSIADRKTIYSILSKVDPTNPEVLEEGDKFDTKLRMKGLSSLPPNYAEQEQTAEDETLGTMNKEAYKGTEHI